MNGAATGGADIADEWKEDLSDEGGEGDEEGEDGKDGEVGGEAETKPGLVSWVWG